MPKRAVIVVDIQNDYFSDGKWPLVGQEKAAGNAARVIDRARAEGDLVVFVRHESGKGAPFFVPGTPGAEIHASVRNRPDEPVVVKNSINAFLKTDLKRTLDEKGIEEVTILGSMSHMCVDAATRAAADYGYKVAVVHDACATHDQEFEGRKVPAAEVHAAFMAALGFGYAKLRSTEDYLGAADAKSG
ncbi:MAG: cysteine hydrolase family protein [Parvibaculaceae bacterium]